MTNKKIYHKLIALFAIYHIFLILLAPYVYASSSLSNNQPPINPEFDPDKSCQFDVSQDKCVPGTEQECPEGFGTNDLGTCFPVDENGYAICPQGYGLLDDYEDGQCYPDGDDEDDQ